MNHKETVHGEVPTREFKVRIPLSLWWLLADQARIDRRSVNAQVIKLLGDALDWERAPDEYGRTRLVWAGDPEFVQPGARARQRIRNNQNGR